MRSMMQNVARDALFDPAPSRLSYRVTRLWLTPAFRKAMRVGVPLVITAGALLWYLGDETRWAALQGSMAEIRRDIENRPEFRVDTLSIEGASPQVRDIVNAALGVDFPVSSFHLDLEELRARLEALPPVRRADLRIQTGGELAVRIEERLPAALWLNHEGVSIVDEEGEFVAGYGERHLTNRLPVIAGEGANLAVPEALDLLRAAAPLAERLDGIVRVGERRWDMVMQSGLRIMLPEEGAVPALRRALELDRQTQLLSRALTSVDLRNPGRPTVRLDIEALEELRAGHSRRAAAVDGGRQG